MEENNINTQVEEDELSVESNEVLDDEELDDETISLHLEDLVSTLCELDPLLQVQKD